LKEKRGEMLLKLGSVGRGGGARPPHGFSLKRRNGNAPDQASDGEKNRTTSQLSINLASDVWMMVATCSSQARNIARNMYNMSGEEGEGRNMEKVFATWEKLFATWKKCSQHDVWILVATSSPQARNMFATNSQHVRHKLATCTLCQGRREGAQHGKNVRNMGKGVRNMEKVFAT
jgi:hypothetical protein